MFYVYGVCDSNMPPELGAQFDVLADGTRRRLLHDLLSAGSETDGGVVSPVVERADLTREEAAVLYHCHLPMLESDGYVHWDRDADAIEPGPAFEEIVPLLECVDDFPRSLSADPIRP